MKRLFGFIICSFLAMPAFSQEAVTLRAAIDAAAAKIEQEVGDGNKVAVYDFISASPQLSTYVIDELIDIFINDKKLTVVERNRLAVVRNEADYQYNSGEVDDNEILSLTHGRGIDFVITGQLDYDGLYWRFRIYAIDTEKRIRVASTSLHIRNNDRQVAYFLNESTSNNGTQLSKKSDGNFTSGKFFRPYIGLYLSEGFKFFRMDDSMFSNNDLFFLGSINASFFEYVEIGLELRYGLVSRMSDGNISSTVGDSWNIFDMNISLLGKYPFGISQKVTLFPLFGFGLNMRLNEISNQNNYEWTREELKDNDTLYLKIGGGLDYFLHKNIMLCISLVYDIYLYSKSVSNADYEKYSGHGPKIMIGINYVF